ncbi:TetR/AcrR family transcriptional regulator [Mycobacterium sp.]|jgi:AcrR family transcriptional regulator|uniref:TetR/AcrR family transcriptional regulator n=1 Tax=Mycobacterium sp. TaxID=1785 RepID=UPI003C73586D
MVNPRATDDDLTAKARIRNAAMDLFAQYGDERVSLREVAAKAGVQLGLVQYHFKTKAGLRDAVDQLVVDHFAQTIAEVPSDGTPAEVVAARDEAVRDMLERTPAVVDYLRRAMLEPSETRHHLLDTLITVTRNEIAVMRDAGLASTERPESIQVVWVLVRQLGELLLQPFIDAVWERVAEPGDTGKPTLSLKVMG